MLNVILWRVAQFPLILAIIYLITFFFVWVAPGSPFGRDDRKLNPQAEAALKEKFHATTWQQFLAWYPYNILRHGDRYVAIDTKAMLGEPEFDVPSFLWNPLNSEMTAERTERRIAAFVAAGLDEGRIRAWTVVRGAYLGIADDPQQAEVLRHLVR